MYVEEEEEERKGKKERKGQILIDSILFDIAPFPPPKLYA
jgi:hypothetical protein